MDAQAKRRASDTGIRASLLALEAAFGGEVNLGAAQINRAPP